MQRLTTTAFFLLSLTYSVYGQTFSATLSKQFKLYREKVVQEKIYVITDRQLYLTGELIWFKVFCMDATSHKPFDVSKVAYVEIMNRNNEPVAQAKIELEKGFGEGSFFLPTSLSSDNYVMRSYTHWMKNFSADFYFHKTISIVNPFVRLEAHDKLKATIKVDFYPEGGALVNSMSTKVAYKISSTSGNQTDYKGFLLNAKNDTIEHLSPSKDGIGSFELQATENQKYRVLVKAKGAENSFHELPPVQQFGYAMKLSDKDDRIEIQIKKIAEKEMQDEDLILFTHVRNMLVRNETKRMLNNQLLFSIDKKDLPAGVAHLSIFNEQGRPVCQRLYFKQPEFSLSTIAVGKPQIELRSKNSIQLSASSKEIQNISISISKIDSLPADGRSSFSDYLGLLSDLGNTAMVNYENDLLSNPGMVDNLLLTKTWERFKWEEILNGSLNMEYSPEPRGHIVHATVADGNGTPQKDVVVYLSSPSKVIELRNVKSDEMGRVSFEMNNLVGSQKLIAQTNRMFDSTSVIKIKNPFSDKFANLTIPELRLTPLDEQRLLARSVRMQAQNIFFEEFENSFKSHVVDSVPFYGKPDEAYKLDDYTRFPIMEEVMREYVPGVVVRKRKDGFNFLVLDKKHNFLFRDAPLIMIDGVPIFDADEIMQFDPLKVKKLDVVTGKYFHGNLELAGIVSYSTYQGDLGGFKLHSKNELINYEGVQLNRQFYSPNHATSTEGSRIPDPRYLLYWNANVRVNTNEKKEIEFFSSDVPGVYLVKVEGISSEGNPIQASATFIVTDKN